MTLHSIVIQKLLSTNAHLGKRVATHHFKVYTYGFRNRMAIIDSDKTLICMRNALDFIGSLVRQKGRFMFVNTNYLFDEIVEEMTKKIGCYNPSASTMWRLGGFLTNSGSPKKFRSRNKKLCFGPTQQPDCLVVLDSERKSSVILEADRLQIPIVALVDSSTPLEIYKRIAYPIPANDSVQFVYLFCNLITKTFLFEQRAMAGAKAVAVTEDPAPSKAQKSEEAEAVEQTKGEEVLIVPYESLAPLPDDTAESKRLLDKLVVVKYSGVSGSTSGFDGSMSALEVSGGLTVLDLMINQIEALTAKYGCHIPLVLIDTAETQEDTLKVLAKHHKSNIDVHSFVQNQNLEPTSFGDQSGDDKLYPSDHHAAFLSLMSSGTLDVLLSQGKEYILLVNPDNVAGVIDPRILHYLINNKTEYCIEVTPSASFAINSGCSTLQKFSLAEIARKASQTLTNKFKFVDTRTLWADLRAIKRLVDTGSLKGSASSEANLQETSLSSTIKFFDHAIGINVPPTHFLPLNSTSDLLLLKSDLYSYDKGILVRNAARTNPQNPSIELGSEFRKINDFLSRFKSFPSIIELESLKVRGDVWFGAGVTLKGRVSIVAKPGMKLEIPDDVVLENEEINDPEDI